MNPIWRLQHDIRRTRADKEKRARQQKELLRHREVKDQRREDAIDRERQRCVSGQESPNDVNDEQEKESSSEVFQRELYWCIQQLEQGLANVKSSSRQGKDAEKLLRTLKSQKAPMVKKRQVMRMTFGDYRKKMMQEKQKHEKKTVEATLTPVASDQQSLSTFFRHAHRPLKLKEEEVVDDTVQQNKTLTQFNTDVKEKKDGEKIVPSPKMEGTDSIPDGQDSSVFMFNFDIDKNLLDSQNDDDNQTFSEKMKSAEIDDSGNNGKRKHKGKKNKHMKDSQKVKTNDGHDNVEDKKGELITKESKEETKDIDQKEFLIDGSGDIQKGVMNLELTGETN
ncbi:UPF0488 protein C8orf33 homolog [Anneissia japonica]|uniref:UPF0488 protein C8orf33 homolog n=1 Tax=Anneissia japonica TaxID=1529436 RepID=UPI0014257140|nr:UPF0488 protein C8orf33 homolog [Anneissia japonica]